MSVVDRLEDACLLLDAGRHEGALNSVLTAISGASRIRYPMGTALSRERPGQSMQDREAFVTFLEDQIALLKAPSFRVKTPKGEQPFSFVLYQIFRCALTHEAGLNGTGTLVPDRKKGRVHFLMTSLDPVGFEISHSAIVFFADLVARAPEHQQAAAAVHARLMSRMPLWRG